MSEFLLDSRESIDMDVKKYLRTLKRRVPIIIGIIVSVCMLSLLATKKLKPSYEASGRLLFREPAFQVIGSNLLSNSGEGGSGELKSLVSTQNPINTQIELINSPSIMYRVIDKLHLTTSKGEPMEPEDLSSILKLKIVTGTDVLQISCTSRSAKEAADIVNAIMDAYIEFDITANRSEAEKTRQTIIRQLPQAETAVHIAEVAIRQFREQNEVLDLSQETTSSVLAIAELDKEIHTLQAQLTDSNSRISELHRIIGLSSQQAILFNTLSRSPAIQGILTQLQDIDRQLAGENSRFLAQNPTIIGLQSKKANLQALLQQQIINTIGFSANFPQKLLQLDQLQEKLIQDVLELELERDGLEKKISYFQKTRRIYTNRTKIIPRLIQKQSELEKKIAIAQTTYDTLFKKVQELKIAENENAATARIVSRPKIPLKPKASKKSVILVLGFLCGLFLAALAVCLLEIRDVSLKTIDDIRKIFEYNLLGIIPLLNKQPSLKSFSQHLRIGGLTINLTHFPTKSSVVSRYTDIIVRDEPDCLASEMYRTIQANLRLLNIGKLPKTIVITSAVSQEGKSTVSANLAAVLAQIGRRVLLIDANMRLPTQHHLWQIKNTLGLSDILMGDIEQELVMCHVLENLDILTGGTRPANPLALLDSQPMSLLLTHFSTKYDFIIIDTPSLLIGADTLTLSQMSDGVLLVARPGVINSPSANTAGEMLKRANCNILGLIVNGVMQKYESNNPFYHPKETYFTPKKTAIKAKMKAISAKNLKF